jgi:methyltransferase-like protein
MHITSPSSSEIFEKERIDKKEYLKNELKSLGIEPKRKDQINDNEELQTLSDNIKQAMFQDYKIAYSEKGEMHKEEAESTVTVG